MPCIVDFIAAGINVFTKIEKPNFRNVW